MSNARTLSKFPSQIFNVDSSNNVGLGATPDQKFTLGGQMTIAGLGGVALNNARGYLLHNAGASVDYGVYLRHYSGSAYDAEILLGGDASNGQNTIRFQTGAVERVKIDTSVMSLSGLQGIKFQAAQSASSDVNTLDDYEEGTWTVTDQSGAGLTFSFATGVYRKIGSLVYVQIDLVFPVTSSSASCVLSLPFVSAATVNDGSSGGGAANYFSGSGIPQAYVSPTGQAKITVYYSTGGASAQMPNSVASGKELSFAFCYHTSN